MRFPPATVMLSWPSPNHVNPVERGPALMVVELASLSVALFCLCLRLYVRFFVVHKTWWDDWLMIAATIFCTLVTMCTILATQRYGWKLHVWDLTPVQMRQGRQISIATQTLFLFASSLSKLSILASYLRIAPLGSLFRRLTWVAIAAIFVLLSVFFIMLWTQCLPAWHYWDLFVGNRNCLDEWPLLAAQSISTVATDVIVYLLPIPTLCRLRLPAAQRLVLIFLFSLGIFVVVAGVMRIYWIHYVEKETYDVTWVGVDLWIWTTLEANLAVVCGCVPVLRRLLPVMPDSKSSDLVRMSAPPTIGSGEREKGKHGDLENDADEHLPHLVNEPLRRSSNWINTPLQLSSPGWSPILDAWARRQHQQRFGH
ncbi:hypothetical protein LX32DRAFT_557779 [Colletotrichum zoysiae]|uniref:Rhodopsin domain-containing protein n=1 Tax=Colletotrichum zoysiae TaxID=1216348 RepID=A0AAD9M400_9PEZI|nr:hypothetical protein LX32DRAFT_557779 [Colletotrichum zoysiae]